MGNALGCVGLGEPLQIAASKGHHEIAALLLENGADANARNLCGQVCLYVLYQICQ